MDKRTKDVIFVTMHPVSIVIICKNEAHIIARSLDSLKDISNDIVVYDSGSTDGTLAVVAGYPVRLHEGIWEGFGKTKNKAISFARHDWILSLDADEAIDERLRQTLLDWKPEGDSVVYELSFKNFLGEKHLAYGEWGTDKHIRLFNRRKVLWNDAPVHESLEFPPDVVVKKLPGHVLHRTMKDLFDYSNKMVNYAMLGAEKYFQQGRRPNWIKLHLSPGFNFLKFYFLKLGFLDGYAGYMSAKMTAWYTFMKYARLKELWKGK